MGDGMWGGRVTKESKRIGAKCRGKIMAKIVSKGA